MGNPLSNRSVLHMSWHDEQVTGAEQHGLSTLHLDTKLTVPAEKEFILFVVVPGKVPFQPRHADNGIVGINQIRGLPRPGQ